VHTEAGESVVGWRARRGHQKRVRVSTRGGPRASRDVEQVGQLRAGRQVDAVGDSAGELGHLRSESADDHGRRR
jgi:hypothetical protein